PAASYSTSMFTSLDVGSLHLKHRVVLAPLTRNRATPSTTHLRTWFPNELLVEHYTQRATAGGLLISEAMHVMIAVPDDLAYLTPIYSPVSLRASGALGVPGLWTDEQLDGWKRVTEAVHAQGAYIICQLWHQGRQTHSRVTGLDTWSSSAVAITGSEHGGGESVPYERPHPMSAEEIALTHDEYVNTALRALLAGFDGVEVHAANGYLPDQFHHSNVNQRGDQYGGSYQNRCRFTVELVTKLCGAIGKERVGVRLAPFGLFNEVNGKERVVQWTYLCSELSKRGIAYVHMIEPRFDEWKSEIEKIDILLHAADDMGVAHESSIPSLKPFRAAIRPPTKLIVAGGYNWINCWDGIDRGDHDAVAFGRYFTSNPDLVERLRTGQRLRRYDRSTFYGPFPDPAYGYTALSEKNREWAVPEDAGQSQLVPPQNEATTEKDTLDQDSSART
ncbi:FMN-linked oxidoreductase, partial [Punctularia strigosozonata HHB-11173 SS5]